MSKASVVILTACHGLDRSCDPVHARGIGPPRAFIALVLTISRAISASFLKKYISGDSYGDLFSRWPRTTNPLSYHLEKVIAPTHIR